MGARRAQRGERFAPGSGWLTEPQQRALREVYCTGEGTGWTVFPNEARARTVISLERKGLIEWSWDRGVECVRLTDVGADIVRRWQEADDQQEAAS